METTKHTPTFREDDIRRYGLPKDVFGILHDLAWSHVGQQDWKWKNLIQRAQDALRLQISDGANEKRK